MAKDFFHLRTAEPAVWPAFPIPATSQVWAAYRELDRTQWLDAAEIERLQLTQLRALLKHSYEQVPYYRLVLDEAGFSHRAIESLDDFRRLPLLTREIYQKNYNDLQARQLPPGMIAAKGSYTSGTNGVPIQVRKTSHDSLWWHALFLRDLEWSNVDPRGRLASIRLIAIDPAKLPAALLGHALPAWNTLCQALLENGPAFAMDIRQEPRRQLEWLAEVRPNYLLSMPTNLEFLAGLMAESGKRLPGLRSIQAIGEPLSNDVKQRIEAGFGVPVLNLYSSTESGYTASPCPAGHGFHVHSENILAEVLDAENSPCKPGETGRLVFTTLHSFAAPFIRYDIMDDVTLAPGPCPCGRGLPLWTKIDGRRYPMLHLPDGRRKTSQGIILGLRQVGGVHQFQVVQRAADHVVLRVVPDQTWKTDQPERMRQIVQSEFESPIRVDVEQLPHLQRPAGGKLKITVIEMDEP